MKLILIDGNSIFHRAYHALPPFKTEQGEPINAVYGFSSMLLNVLNTEKPDFVYVAFDMKAKTFRHKEYEDYKATRKKAPDDLYAQFPRVKEVLTAFNIPYLELEGYEADDIIGTLADKSESSELITETIVLTSDRDALQLVKGKTKVLAPVKGIKTSIVFDREKVFEKYSVFPEQIVDYKGLMGDSSDNIKGVKGVGKKTAEKLLAKYKTIENIYKNIEDLKGALKTKMLDGKEDAFQSKFLATIVLDVPIKLNLDDARLFDCDLEKASSIFYNLSFSSLANKLKSFDKVCIEKRAKEKFEQKSLF